MSRLAPRALVASVDAHYRRSSGEALTALGYEVRTITPRVGRVERQMAWWRPEVVVLDAGTAAAARVARTLHGLDTPPVLVAVPQEDVTPARVAALVSGATGERRGAARRFSRRRRGIWKHRRMAISVVVADDHRLVLEALRSALAGAEDFEVVGETDSGAHVLPLVARHSPDLVLMDVNMPGMDGLTALDQIRERHPEVKVVLISASNAPDEIESALRRGAAGYLVKSIDPADIPAALRQAMSGTAFYALGGGESTEEHLARTVGLTDRELTILRAVARGLSNKQVAQELFVTEQTVKFHLSNVYRKIGVSNRAGAVQFAMRNGLAPA